MAVIEGRNHLYTPCKKGRKIALQGKMSGGMSGEYIPRVNVWIPSALSCKRPHRQNSAKAGGRRRQNDILSFWSQIAIFHTPPAFYAAARSHRCKTAIMFGTEKNE